MFKKHFCFKAIFVLLILFITSCAAKNHDHSIEIYFGIDGDVYTDERKALEKGHYTLKYVSEDDTLADVLARVSASTNMEPSSWDGSGWKRSNYGDYGFTAVDGNSNTQYIYNFDWNDTRIKFRRNNPFSYQVIGLDDQIGDITALYPDYTKQELIEVPIYHAFYDSTIGKTSKYISAQEINANFLRTVYRLPANSTIPTDIWSVSTLSGSDDWFSNTAVTNYLRTSKNVSKQDYGYIDSNGRYLSFNPSYNDYMSGHCMYYLITSIDDSGEPRFKTEDGSSDRVVISSDNLNFIVGTNRDEGHLTFKKNPDDADDEGEYVGLYPVYKELKETVHVQYYNRVGSADNRITDSYEVNVGNPFLTPTQLRNQQGFSWNPLKEADDESEIDYGYQATGGAKLSYTQSKITLADGNEKNGWLFYVCDSNFNETAQTVFASTDGGDIVNHEYYLKPYYNPEDAIVIHIAYYTKDGSEEKRTTIEMPKSYAFMPSPSSVEGLKDLYDDKLKYGYVTTDGRHKKIYDAVDGKYAYTYTLNGMPFTINASASTNPATAYSESDKLDDSHNGITFRPVYVDDTVTLNIVIKVTVPGGEPSDVTLSLTLKSGDTLEDLKGRLIEDLSSYKYDPDSPIWNVDDVTGDFGYIDENGYYYSFSIADAIEDVENVFVFKDADGNTLTSKDEITTNMVVYPKYGEPMVNVTIHYYVTGASAPVHYTFSKQVRKGASLSDISLWMDELKSEYLSKPKYDGEKEITGTVDTDLNCKLYDIEGSDVTVTNDGYGDEYFRTELQCGYRDYSRYGRRFYFDFNEDSKFILYNSNPNIRTEFNKFDRVVEDIDLYPLYTNAGYAPMPSVQFGPAGNFNTVFVPVGTSPYPRTEPYTFSEVWNKMYDRGYTGNPATKDGWSYAGDGVDENYYAEPRVWRDKLSSQLIQTSIPKRANETEIPTYGSHSLTPLDRYSTESLKTNYFELMGDSNGDYVLPSPGTRMGDSTYGLKISEIPLSQEFVYNLIWKSPVEQDDNVRVLEGGFEIAPTGMDSPHKTPPESLEDFDMCGLYAWSSPNYYERHRALETRKFISYKTSSNSDLFAAETNTSEYKIMSTSSTTTMLPIKEEDYNYRDGVHDIYPWTGAGCDHITFAALCNYLTYVEDGGSYADCVYYFDKDFTIPVTTTNRYTIVKNAIEQFNTNALKYYLIDYAQIAGNDPGVSVSQKWEKVIKSTEVDEEKTKENENITASMRKNASFIHCHPTPQRAQELTNKINALIPMTSKYVLTSFRGVFGDYIQKFYYDHGGFAKSYYPRIYKNYQHRGYRLPTVLEAEYMKKIVLNELQIPNEDESGNKMHCNTLDFPDHGAFYLWKFFDNPDAFELGKPNANQNSVIMHNIEVIQDQEGKSYNVRDFLDEHSRPTNRLLSGHNVGHDSIDLGLSSYTEESLGYKDDGTARCIDGYDLVENKPSLYDYYFQTSGTNASGHSLRYYGDLSSHPEYRTFFDCYTAGYKNRVIGRSFVLATEFLKKNLNRRNGANIFDMNVYMKTDDTGYVMDHEDSAPRFNEYVEYNPFEQAKSIFGDRETLIEMFKNTFTTTALSIGILYFDFINNFNRETDVLPGKGESDWNMTTRRDPTIDSLGRNSVASVRFIYPFMNNFSSDLSNVDMCMYVCREVPISADDYKRIDNKWNQGGTGPAN